MKVGAVGVGALEVVAGTFGAVEDGSGVVGAAVVEAAVVGAAVVGAGVVGAGVVGAAVVEAAAVRAAIVGGAVVGAATVAVDQRAWLEKTRYGVPRRRRVRGRNQVALPIVFSTPHIACRVEQQGRPKFHTVCCSLLTPFAISPPQ